MPLTEVILYLMQNFVLEISSQSHTCQTLRLPKPQEVKNLQKYYPEKRNDGVSPVIGAIILTAMIVISFSIISVTVLSFTADAAPNAPNVRLQPSADEHIIYHAGGRDMKRSDLSFYDANGTDISSLVEIKSAGDQNTNIWSTGGFVFSTSLIELITLQDSNSGNHLIYQRGIVSVQPVGNMVPDNFEIPPPTPEPPAEAGTYVTIGNLYEITNPVYNRREILATINVSIDEANSTNLSLVAVKVKHPGPNTIGRAISIDAADLTSSSRDPLPLQVVYGDPKDTVLTYGVFFDRHPEIFATDYAIPYVAAGLYTDLEFTVYGVYRDGSVKILHTTPPMTFMNIIENYPPYHDIIFMTPLEPNQEYKYILGSSHMKESSDYYDSPLLVPFAKP